MKTSLILVGRTQDKLYREAIEDYASRISHYIPFGIKMIPEVKNTRAMTEAVQKEKEGALILRELSPQDYVVLLDEHGTERSSTGFAQWLQKRLLAGRQLTFVIGGPYGFSDAVYKRADDKVSLSQMTFSHQMVRLIFAEQLYRACTIMKGEKYHHE